MARAARPCQREAAEGRQSHAAVSWQGADATPMTYRRAFCGLLQHAHAGAPSAVLFLLQMRAVSEKSDRALGSEACDRATPTRMAVSYTHLTLPTTPYV